MLNKAANSIFKIFIEIFIFDKKKRSYAKAKYAKRKLRKYIDAAVPENVIPQPEYKDEKIIWQYWHDGAENAPNLVQKCFASVKTYMAEYRQIILNYETIKDYVELPKRYYDLLELGKMSIAHFSDILRVYLLSKYGGTWIDSTIYLTGKVPEDIMKSKFFVFQKNPLTDDQQNKMSCFFIHAEPDSVNLAAMKNFLDLYWGENDFVINYFMFEHASTLFSEASPELKNEWSAMPYYDSDPTKPLQKYIFEDYTESGWQNFTSQSNIHKLSYKIIREQTSGKSYYDYIIQN